jgi:2-polyprenyl-3-methyl-5-hydroxy-6-metoxy-1,4-benzoquinol methylase
LEGLILKMTPQTHENIVPTREGYDRWAATYDTDGNPLQALEEPRVDELLGDVRGLAVLDVGCGTGRHAIRLARRGAVVQAVDFSSSMLEKARAKAEGLTVTFGVHDLSMPLPFSDESFDRVVCGLVIDHIADLQFLFGEMQRVCRKTGAVVVSVMHPAMMLRGVQARFDDAESGAKIYPASCPHQISDYCLAAVRAGFKLDQLGEHAPDQALADRLERAKRYVGWPMLFVMRLV